jgi:methionine synthase II (cobalamin-independent)
VPTASGFHRHRSVDAPAASQALEWVFAGAGSATTVAHCCAADAPVALLHGAGAEAVSVDLQVLAAAAYDELATVLDQGGQAWLGVVPSGGSAEPTTRAALDRTRRLLDMLGFDPEEVSDRVVLTPACGLAGAGASYARAALRAVREAAAELG